MKTALVTGANRGIGLATARQLLASGYFVYLGVRDELRGEEAATALVENGYHNLSVLGLDVTDDASVSTAVDRFREHHQVLDLLINNAGVLGEVPQPASRVGQGNLRAVFETNLFGVIRVTQAFLPLMRTASLPVVINVSSGLASLTSHQDPTWEFDRFRPAAFVPSKAAMNAYTMMLAKELADDGFKVNCVDPGHTATAFNNYAGPQPVEEAAGIILRYATCDAASPTGRFFADTGELPW